ncbi:hypothetical protein HPB50_006770 [Hyalomma asiaticum]|uniref:Uncharacterized protein n=1 Tax=Hyalomma asiaticum TaxID=266040 RepID=A0ACB7SP46_HYAAI|nr:hypothetical protein HPB50_006770 [Hyalomma asiaticum]
MESHPVRQEATGAQRALTGADTSSMNGRSHAAARELCAPPRHRESPTASLPVVGEREYAECLRATPPRPAGVFDAAEPGESPRNKQRATRCAHPRSGTDCYGALLYISRPDSSGWCRIKPAVVTGQKTSPPSELP